MSSSKQHTGPTRQSVKLMSHGAVLRIREFKFNCVQTGKNRTETQAAGGQQVLLKSDKTTFCLPAEMPSLHIEYLSFYFPNELDFPGMNIDDSYSLLLMKTLFCVLRWVIEKLKIHIINVNN